MFNVIIDFHHYELALSTVLLLNRLGIHPYIPNEALVKRLLMYGFGYESFHAIPKFTQVKYKEAADFPSDIDLCISSIPQNYRVYKNLHKKVIQQIGNHEWTLEEFDNVLTSDMFSYERFKYRCPTCYYYPEFDKLKYKPKLVENNIVRSYLYTLYQPYTYEFCKVCNLTQKRELPDYATFAVCQDKLSRKGIQLIDHPNTGGDIPHHQIGDFINNSRLTWHFKTIEGYGFSAITSMYSGVPVIINPKWLHGTTLGMLAIPYKTAIYSDYDAKHIIEAIRLFFRKSNQAETLERCHNTIAGLLDFEYEASKVKDFISHVI